MQGLIKAIRMVVDTGKIARWDSEDFEIGATGVKMQVFAATFGASSLR
jgi:hypothetical protein